MRKFLIVFFILLLLISVHAKVVIFLYHRFDDTRYPTTSTSLQELQEHIQIVKQLNLPIWTLQDLESYINGKKDLEGQTAVLFTVDDGYRSVYEKALPVFKKHNVPFSVFMCIGSVGFKDYLDWNMIADMMSQGVEFGHHSFSHKDFTSFDSDQKSEALEEFRQDLIRGREVFYAHTGQVLKYYAYPYGHYSHEMGEILSQEGFTIAFSQDPGPFRREYNRYTVPREPLLQDWAGENHVKYILWRKPLLVQEPAYTFEDSLVVNARIIEPKDIQKAVIYITEKGVLNCELKDSYVISEPIDLRNASNRLMISVKDTDGIEYVKYWFIGGG